MILKPFPIKFSKKHEKSFHDNPYNVAYNSSILTYDCTIVIKKWDTNVTEREGEEGATVQQSI